jgi:Oxidoreductase molybdopterin binding domain/Mo-co oxidoreductase dimerisation domain
VRSHVGVPKLERDAWRLIIEGPVKQPFEFAFDELVQMPSRTLTMTLECAGNSRIFLSPKVGGLQWELGAVGNAEWTGVPLSAVLKRAGVKAGQWKLCSKEPTAAQSRKSRCHPERFIMRAVCRSQIARPALHEIVPTDAIYRVYGAAWTGESEVSRVEVSTEAGNSWEQAQLLGESLPYAWRLWE